MLFLFLLIFLFVLSISVFANSCSGIDDCYGETPYCNISLSECVECIIDSHCDDSNDCTIDLCSSDICLNVNVADATSCSNGSCCSGICDTSISNLDFHADCRLGPSCAGSSFEYTIINNGNICGETDCFVCNDGYCNLNDETLCADNKCYEPICSSGSCGQIAVSLGETDEGCFGDIGCFGGDCKCDGSGLCSSQPTCSDECTNGTTQCNGLNIQSCGDYDGDGCYEWDNGTACTDNLCYNPICNFGLCGQIAVELGQTDMGCSGSIGCDGGDCKCDGLGSCSSQPSCLDECSSGQTQCDETSVQSCGDYDSDGCYEWNSGTSCADNKCSEPACNSGVCGEIYVTSGYEDEACFGDIGCYGGDCKCDGSGLCISQPGCSDECTTAATRCDGLNLETCGDYDSDGCVEWNGGVACLDNICYEPTCNTTSCGEMFVNVESIDEACHDDIGCSGGNCKCDGSGSCISYSVVDTNCISNCTDKLCGDDGCGASCGSCMVAYVNGSLCFDEGSCEDGQCVYENYTLNSNSGCCNKFFGVEFNSCIELDYQNNSLCDIGEVCDINCECRVLDCTPDWICSEWSECLTNNQTRSCSDNNNCDSDYNKPVLLQECITENIVVTSITTPSTTYDDPTIQKSGTNPKVGSNLVSDDNTVLESEKKEIDASSLEVSDNIFGSEVSLKIILPFVILVGLLFSAGFMVFKKGLIKLPLISGKKTDSSNTEIQNELAKANAELGGIQVNYAATCQPKKNIEKVNKKNEKLAVNYVAGCLSKKMTKDDIKLKMLSSGWDQKFVEDILNRF